MDKQFLELTLEERSCLRRFLELKIGQLAEAAMTARNKNCPAIEARMDKDKRILVDILAKM